MQCCASRGVVGIGPRWVGAPVEQQSCDRVMSELDGRAQRTTEVRPRVLNLGLVLVEELGYMGQVPECCRNREVVGDR